MSQAAKDIKNTIEDLKGAAKDIATDTKDVVEQIAHTAADTAENAANAGKQIAHAAVSNTQDVAVNVAEKLHSTAHQVRRTASEAIDSSGRHIRNADEETSPLIDNFANRAQDLAERSINFWADTSHSARRQFNSAANATNKYVAEQPGRSLLIAAATGAALATAFFLGRSRRK